MNAWITIDTDDLRHLPRYQGHPTRSKHTAPTNTDDLSEDFQRGLEGFKRWMESHGHGVTLFVITDLFECESFRVSFKELLTLFGNRMTVGCHGHSHRSWSAWPQDDEGFSSMLQTSTVLLKKYAGSAFRPWFRAPNGYVAPWMAEVLARHEYTVDSSINPSWVVKSKSGKGTSWSQVSRAMDKAGLIEREWLTKWTFPVNGPALFRFPLSLIAQRAWRTLPEIMNPEQLNRLVPSRQKVVTVYCHLLDFARHSGAWQPLIRLTGQ